MYPFHVMFIEEKPEEEGQNNDGLDSGSIIGIVIACLVAALLVLILITVAVIAVFRDRKKRIGKAEFRYIICCSVISVKCFPLIITYLSLFCTFNRNMYMHMQRLIILISGKFTKYYSYQYIPYH